ncbi:cation efflux protein [Penicillium cinerascens]|uniref:Cation efflux protein n=1 Tax=Penicillium cinerascens TaxID=70096 RepID=A0A9W9NBJ6_9EURO|nr:cation efflux protein [Penicillium cinerascens]KAJ5215874.1 cation efflux protein [Penicillium cinerascens]
MFKLSRVQRLSAVIGFSLCFFVAEISVGFYTHSLALVADAFHYLNDIVGFMIALAAAVVADKNTHPKALTFGWQRVQLLGAFFNGVLLFGLAISVFLQSIERFVSMQRVEQPKLVLIMGCVGLGLNILSVIFLHGKSLQQSSLREPLLTAPIDHDHGHDHNGSDGHSHDSPNEDSASISLVSERHVHHKHHTNASDNASRGSNRDLAMMGVLIHVLGDCANNVGVIIAAAVIWFAHYEGRYYADPAVSMGIAVMIFLSSIPLIRRAGLILLQSAPQGVDHDDVKHDLEEIPGVLSIHELHIWRLNQTKSLASAHVVLDDDNTLDFDNLAKTIRECFHAYGIHSLTLQPEILAQRVTTRTDTEDRGGARRRTRQSSEEQCKFACGSLCQGLACCQ